MVTCFSKTVLVGAHQTLRFFKTPIFIKQLLEPSLLFQKALPNSPELQMSVS